VHPEATRLKILALAAAAVALPAAVAGVALHSALFTNVGWTAAPLAAGFALLHASRRTSDPDPGAWRLLAVASFTWFAGQIFWDMDSLSIPARVPADVLWLAFAFTSAVGLARVASFGAGGRELVLESIPVVVATGALVTAVLYGDVMASDLGTVQLGTSLAYPVLYSAVPVVMAQVLLGGRIRIHRRPDVALLFLGIAAQAAAFGLWAPRLLAGTYVVGGKLDALWSAGLLLMAAGGLMHKPSGLVLRAESARRFAGALPGAMFVALLGALLAGSAAHWQLGRLIVLEVGALAVGALIGIRIAVLSRQQRRLLESERQTRLALERAADELTHVALHDSLTGLPNRALFIDRTEHALGAARRERGCTGVLFLDVDDFKQVNDVFGHSAGDALLREVGARLESALRPGDTVARFGGDEFTVLCPGLAEHRHAARVARRITRAIATPFVIGERTLHVTASVGIAFAEPDRTDVDAESLVRDADTAMYRAKASGRGEFEIFNEAVRERLVERLRIEDALRTAAARGEMRLAYQPLVRLHDHRVVGFEALVRWDSPELGEVEPSVFVPIAEQTGQIGALGGWVLRTATAEMARLRELHPELELELAVNISARQILDRSLPRQVRKALSASGLPAHALALEITESALVEDAAHVLESLNELRDLGVRLMLDDFGTGFSSLGYLKRFPVDALKIDRSFVDGLGHDPEDRAIVAAIMGVADALDLDVVAEGVETARQVSELLELGCDVAQGYRFARPTFDPAALLGGAGGRIVDGHVTATHTEPTSAA
jgi:diguanylate cyclase (GGDEF)-like protein